jgi:virginiamycin B lyase
MLDRTLALVLVLATGACSRLATPAVTTTSASVRDGPVADLSTAVELREYPLAAPDAYPRDIALAPDGALWITAEGANALVRLDPSTGTLRRYGVKAADSRPSGLAIAPDGHVWFMASARAYLGDFDPVHDTVVDHPLPDARAKDPRAAAFASDGRLWFTVEQGGFVGVFTPSTGEFALRPLKRPGARPDAIVIGKDGAAYVAERGSNHIARIDPTSMAVREYELAEGVSPRGLALAPDGSLFFTDDARGRIGRLDPATGVTKEWRSPSGASSHPNGIAVTPDGVVWYSESGAKPPTLVRFNPKTHELGSMPLPSGGVVRSIAITPSGQMFLACTSKKLDSVLAVTPLAALR